MFAILTKNKILKNFYLICRKKFNFFKNIIEKVCKNKQVIKMIKVNN